MEQDPFLHWGKKRHPLHPPAPRGVFSQNLFERAFSDCGSTSVVSGGGPPAHRTYPGAQLHNGWVDKKIGDRERHAASAKPRDGLHGLN